MSLSVTILITLSVWPGSAARRAARLAVGFYHGAAGVEPTPTSAHSATNCHSAVARSTRRLL